MTQKGSWSRMFRLDTPDGDAAVARQLTNDWYTEQFTEPEEEQEEIAREIEEAMLSFKWDEVIAANREWSSRERRA